MRPRDIAAQLRSITPAALGGLSSDALIGIASTLATIGPKIIDILDGVDERIDIDAELAAAIDRAAANNRSGNVRTALEAELAALKGIP